MSSSTSDVLILGGGAMGTAAAYHLARRGCSVRLFERHTAGHELGSSHGYSRIIRRAYYEHPSYVPLVERSYALWRELEAESREALMRVTGIVELGAPTGGLLQGSLASCREHAIPHQRLSAAQVCKRFPQFSLPEWAEGVWQADGAILAVERCVLAHRRLAAEHGASVHENEPVLELNATAKSVRVTTPRGHYSARQAVVCAGPWASQMLKELRLPLVVTRQAQGFYHPVPTAEPLFEPERFPLFLMELPGHSYYGFPFFGVRCMKVAHHGGGQIVDPDSVDRAFNAEDDRLLRDFLSRYIPAANGALAFGKICLYTNTPDHDFIVDRHPRHNNVWLAAGFSGHGFKFSPVIGEILADLAQHAKTGHDIARFSLSRFPHLRV